MNTKQTYNHKVWLWLLSVFTLMGTINAQNYQDLSDADVYKEKFSVVTDRSIYSAGENIYFSVFNLSNEKLIESEWSKILYAELITPGGDAVIQSKVYLKNESFDGVMIIPDDLKSGTYYLRVYTKWLRNYSPSDYGYLSIRIINPDSKLILPVDSGIKLPAKYPDDIVSHNSGYKVTIDKDSYSKREWVSLYLSSDIPFNQRKKIVISVVPSGSLHKQIIPDLTSGISDIQLPVEYFPETQGISLSGKIIDSGNQQALPYSMVYLTMLNNHKWLKTIMSDPQGNFNLSLPQDQDQHDIFISANNPGSPSEILIDNDFCPLPLTLPSYPLNLDSSDYDLCIRIINAVEIKNQFYPEKESDVKSASPVNPWLFYGKPSITIEMSDYIELPDMEEYIHELLPMISIRKNKSHKEFVINGIEPELSMYSPLVMIDCIPIHDIESILRINPSKLARIEIVNSPYILGYSFYGGIISLISKKNDFGGADLPINGLFLNFKFLSKKLPFPQETEISETNLPDVRNTLYWNPGLFPGEEKAVVRFRTGDLYGSYDIIIRSFNELGDLLETRTRFMVK